MKMNEYEVNQATAEPRSPMPERILLRPYRAEDAERTRDIFLRAVQQTASDDYSHAQIEAWISGAEDMAEWAARRAAAHTWVASLQGEICGFSDVDADGYIDMMFVDPALSRRGVATALLQKVSQLAFDRGALQLTVNASRTARRFFERWGFVVVREQEVIRNGVTLSNYRMATVARRGAE